MDRASGSGVFARDPDALLDMIQINPKDVGKNLEGSQTAWRISTTLREFPNQEDIDVIFDYPVHRITDELKEAKPLHGMDAYTNSQRGNTVKNEKAEERYQRIVNLVVNWEDIDTKVPPMKYPKVSEVVEYFKSDQGFSDNTIRNQIDKHDDLVIRDGWIIPITDLENL